MKPNELKIGNYVLLYNPEFWEQYIDKIVKVEGIDLSLSTKEKEVWKDSFGSLKLVCKEETFNQFSQYAKPIPLTEECVFELEDKYWDFVGYGTRLIYQDRLHPAIKIEKSKTQWAFYFNDELINFKEYLHEAQNLYFALTGTELTFENKM